jgi:hypothetical protein
LKDTVKILELNRYEVGIVVNALVELRNKLIKELTITEPVDELLLKTMDCHAHMKPTYKKLEER